MFPKIDSQTQSFFAPKQKEAIDITALKMQLVDMLKDFPYDTVNLETDSHIIDVLDLIKDDVEIDRSSVIISKDKLIEALLSDKCDVKKQEPTENNLNPAMNTLSMFNLVSQNQEKSKAQQYQKFQEISADLDNLSQTMSLFQTQSSGDRIDFSSNDQAKSIIDKVRIKWGLPPGSSPYAWDNKQDVISFITQKQKELTHRSQEVMLNLQHCADQLKSMVDATKEILKLNNDLIEYINRKTTAG